eukprot:1067636-Alexandrium_andersonii.AAC.1
MAKRLRALMQGVYNDGLDEEPPDPALLDLLSGPADHETQSLMEAAWQKRKKPDTGARSSAAQPGELPTQLPEDPEALPELPGDMPEEMQ